jgi:molybdenum ABC transporter molybdate-binding protein
MSTDPHQEHPDHPRWAADWQIGVRLWVQRAGQALLGEGRADLLAAIDRTHSISAAARDLDISYRRAWDMVQQINQAAGEPLVMAAPGGVKGGGAQLTSRGLFALQVFEQLRTEVRTSAAGVLAKVLAPTADLAGSVHLAAAISLQEVVGQLLAEYALQLPGVRVRSVFGASNELADHILSGAPCDLLITADPLHLDRLDAAQLLHSASRTVLAANSLTVIGPHTAPTLRKPDELLDPAFKCIALADPDSPLGKCSRAYLETRGLYERLLAKSVRADNSRAVLASLAAGRADTGLAFGSDTTHADCKILLAVDPAVASLEYWAAVVRTGRRAVDAEALLKFFATPQARRLFLTRGFAAPKRRRVVR